MANVTAVLKQLQQERARLASQLDALNKALSALGTKAIAKKRRKLSATALARIRAAQKARWAKWRKLHKKA